ncbi:MAG TPA: aldo/keto reductase [Solirubrobacterales bacterium]
MGRSPTACSPVPWMRTPRSPRTTGVAEHRSFKGEAYRRNVAVVRELERFASEELGVSVSRLAIAWTLSNPAVQVAIVGARHPHHIADSVAAAELSLSEADLERIDRIMAGSAPMTGPHPEMMPE